MIKPTDLDGEKYREWKRKKVSAAKVKIRRVMDMHILHSKQDLAEGRWIRIFFYEDLSPYHMQVADEYIKAGWHILIGAEVEAYIQPSPYYFILSKVPIDRAKIVHRLHYEEAIRYAKLAAKPKKKWWKILR